MTVSARHSEGPIWYRVRVRLGLVLGLAFGGPSLWRPQTGMTVVTNTVTQTSTWYLWESPFDSLEVSSEESF